MSVAKSGVQRDSSRSGTAHGDVGAEPAPEGSATSRTRPAANAPRTDPRHSRSSLLRRPSRRRRTAFARSRPHGADPRYGVLAVIATPQAAPPLLGQFVAFDFEALRQDPA